MNSIETPSDVRHLIENSVEPLLLVFVSEKCDHSEDLKKALSDLGKYLKDAVHVVYFEVSKDPIIAALYGVYATPTSLLIHRGTTYYKWVGVFRWHNYYDVCAAYLQSTPLECEEMAQAGLLPEEEQEEAQEEQEIPF
jgi:thioredoxin-like negative regulator of GroEL